MICRHQKCPKSLVLVQTDIEIMNPAKRPTNPKLAEYPYQAGYIERFGTGMGEIFRLSKEFNLLEPTIDLTEGFKVTIWRPSAQVTPIIKINTDHDTDHVDELVRRLIKVISGSKSRQELMDLLDLKHNPSFRDNYLHPAIEAGYIEMTKPEALNSKKQLYRLTQKGIELKKYL